MEQKIRELIKRFEADYKLLHTATATYMVGEVTLGDGTKAQVQIIITTDVAEFLNEIPV